MNPWTLFPGPLVFLSTFIVSSLLFRSFIWECFSEDIFWGFSGLRNCYQLLHWHGRNWEFIVQCCESCGVHVPGKAVERKPDFSGHVFFLLIIHQPWVCCMGDSWIQNLTIFTFVLRPLKLCPTTQRPLINCWLSPWRTTSLQADCTSLESTSWKKKIWWQVSQQAKLRKSTVGHSSLLVQHAVDPYSDVLLVPALQPFLWEGLILRWLTRESSKV